MSPSSETSSTLPERTVSKATREEYDDPAEPGLSSIIGKALGGGRDGCGITSEGDGEDGGDLREGQEEPKSGEGQSKDGNCNDASMLQWGGRIATGETILMMEKRGDEAGEGKNKKATKAGVDGNTSDDYDDDDDAFDDSDVEGEEEPLPMPISSTASPTVSRNNYNVEVSTLATAAAVAGSLIPSAPTTAAPMATSEVVETGGVGTTKTPHANNNSDEQLPPPSVTARSLMETIECLSPNDDNLHGKEEGIVGAAILAGRCGTGGTSSQDNDGSVLKNKIARIGFASRGNNGERNKSSKKIRKQAPPISARR